ncbi:MAG: phosphatase PAP2 family protein [Gemmatimonadota bacterium]
MAHRAPWLTRVTEGLTSHASAAVLAYGVMAFVASAWIREWSHRVTMLMLVALLVLLIGLSRLYLGVHYLSDVLGATTLSIAWLALCLTAVETYRRYREEEASGT